MYNPYKHYNNRLCNNIYRSDISKDYGDEPFIINLEYAARQNTNFRTTIWTGSHLQVTLMSINVGESIGLEIHPDVDQFIMIERGYGLVQMGDEEDSLTFEQKVFDDSAVIIPAGKWHNITNIGAVPLKLYSIYAPPNHKKGTIHITKKDAEYE